MTPEQLKKDAEKRVKKERGDSKQGALERDNPRKDQQQLNQANYDRFNTREK